MYKEEDRNIECVKSRERSNLYSGGMFSIHLHLYANGTISLQPRGGGKIPSHLHLKEQYSKMLDVSTAEYNITWTTHVLIFTNIIADD